MQAQIKSWGNSQGVRFPKEFLEASGFKLNDSLEIHAMKDQIVLSRPFVHKTLKERAEAYNGHLNLHQELDWGEPVGSEVW